MLIGRRTELEQLNQAYANGDFQLTVVSGRRHIGKTFLVSEFVKDKSAVYFSAKEVNDRCNLDAFAVALGCPGEHFENWDDAFNYFGAKLRDKRTILVIDNFTDACITGREFAMALQKNIEKYFRSKNLFLIICGNHAAALEREVFGNKAPLHDDVTLTIHLDCLSYQEACPFMCGFSDEDKVRLYSCIGGTPLYLKQIDSNEFFEENIIRLFFQPTGFIYNDIFMLLRKELIGPVVYNTILRSIANGKTHLRDIVEEIGEEKTKVSKYCKVLMDMDILGRTVPYGKDAENSRKNPYYFKDNAHLFWYRFVFDNDLAIAKGEGAKLAGDKVFGSALDTHIVNLTFDRICLQYYNHLSKIGNLSFTPNFIGLIDDSAGADVIVSDKNGQSIIAVQCLWNKPAVGAAELNDFVEHYGEFADNPQYSIVSANGYKTDAMRLADSRNDIELLGLDDLEAKR